jgi:hypothetical protein
MELVSGVTIAKYVQWRGDENRNSIANLIHRRFAERYLAPITGSGKHGFTMMAISSLMVEALSSFENGWDTTRGMGSRPFQLFFAAHSALEPFNNIADEFYRNIRCGLLHQAETKGGWRIFRKGPLCDTPNRSINATAFARALDQALVEYVTKLKSLPWNADLWRNAICKLDCICANCRPGARES